jgi:NADP-dependent 3-hydroxy acid dehydrogenase YdfG
MFQNKNYIVTGGANGIGLATARLLKARGAQVILWDVREDQLQGAGQKLGLQDYAVVNVTDAESIQRGLDAAQQQYGRVDGVIHCAGIARVGMFEAVSIEQHRAVIETNLFGTLAVSHTALPLLRQSKGTLVLVSSVSAFYGLLRIELTGSGVYLGVISPHFVDTALYREESTKGAVSRGNPLFIELLTAETIASAIVKGIEQRKFMIWASWKSRLLYLFSRYGDFLAGRMMAKTWLDARKG